MAKKSIRNNEITIIRSILLVSLDTDLIMKFKSFMMAGNYVIICAESLLDAAAQLVDKHIDTMVADIDVIDADSLKFLHIINHLKRRLPIIIVTSDNSIESSRRLLEQGVRYVELKPINFHNLSNVITKLHELPSIDRIKK